MTLIEVLAGLVVLGTVLASVTIARGRFMRQTARAQQKIEASRAVDEMLSSWFARPSGAVVIPSQGILEGSGRFAWRTNWRVNRAAEDLGARSAQLDVFDPRGASEPVLTVEFIVRDIRQSPPATQPSEVQ